MQGHRVLGRAGPAGPSLLWVRGSCSLWQQQRGSPEGQPQLSGGLTMPCLTIQSPRLFSLPPPIW